MSRQNEMVTGPERLSRTRSAAELIAAIATTSATTMRAGVGETRDGIAPASCAAFTPSRYDERAA